jgi:hypothetical protein
MVESTKTLLIPEVQKYITKTIEKMQRDNEIAEIWKD